MGTYGMLKDLDEIEDIAKKKDKLFEKLFSLAKRYKEGMEELEAASKNYVEQIDLLIKKEKELRARTAFLEKKLAKKELGIKALMNDKDTWKKIADDLGEQVLSKAELELTQKLILNAFIPEKIYLTAKQVNVAKELLKKVEKKVKNG